MKTVIQKSLQDIFSLEVIFFVTKTAFIAFMFAFPVIWFFEDALANFIHLYLQWIPSDSFQNYGARVITWSISYTIFIVIVLLLTLKNSEKLLIKLAKKHYPNLVVHKAPHIFVSMFVTFKSFMIFFMALMFCMPFLPIPILGQGLMLYLLSILIKKPMYRLGSLFISDKKVFKEKMNNSNKIALLATLFNYIPIVNIFAPMFRQILFLHHILD